MPMYIRKIIIEGFRTFRKFELELDEHVNIIVGDNETGKTTLLEAIYLVLSCQIEGRSIQYELNPHIFNCSMVKEYFAAIRRGEHPSPPYILIEAYLDEGPDNNLAPLRGLNNSAHENSAGLYLRVEMNEDFAEDFQRYVCADDTPEIVPTEYYTVAWRSFADNAVAGRNLPFGARIIDTSVAGGHTGPNKYLARLISDVLDEDQRRELSMAYRRLKHSFMKENGIKEINARLDAKKGDVTNKTLTVSMDMTGRSTWDSSIAAHLDDIPFDSVGKGKQSCVKMKLAIEAATHANVLLIEEPENHLSHSNMWRLIREIRERARDRQIVVTTHSSFVLNKLGIDSLRLLSPGGNTMTVAGLTPETRDFFMRLPGYDTLRLLLATKSVVLVEGPSDELIVQKA